MLNINPEIVCNVALKAQEFQEQIDVEIPVEGNAPTYAERELLLAEYRHNLVYGELRRLLSDLEPDQQETIIALMYIGQGDFEKNEWSLAIEQARTIPEQNRADYLISKPQLADYLRDALANFGYACEN